MQKSSLRVRLYVLTGSSVGDELLVENEAILGRMPDCGLVLHDQGVSRQHAKIVVEEDGAYVEDLGSSNGTKLAGHRVQKARIEDGAVFTIGPTEIRVRLEGGPESVPAPTPPSADPPVQPRVSVTPRSDSSPSAQAPTAPSDAVGMRQDGRGPQGILQYSKKGKHGLHAEDLSQRSLISRLTIIVLVLGAGALIFYLAYHAGS